LTASVSASLRPGLLLTLLLIGALARVAVLTLPGTLDVPDWKATSYVASSDFLHIYGRGGQPPEQRKLEWQDISVTTEYPPISHVEMAIVGRIYRLFDPAFGDSRLLTALVKLPGLLAELAFVGVLLTVGRRLVGDRVAQWIAIAFWLNPGIWLAGAVLGYLDAQMAVPATLALLAAADDRPKTAGVLAGMAVLTKPQAIFLFPVLGLMLLRRDGAFRWGSALQAAAAGLAVFIVAFVPFAAAGVGSSVLRAFQRLGEHDLVSGTATNLWWILTWAAGSAARVGELGIWAALSRPATMVRISTVLEWGFPNPRTIGTVLTALALAWAMWRGRHGLSRTEGALLGAWCVLAYFMVSGQVHENHAYLALPLLALAAGEDARLRPLFWAITAAFSLNLYLFYGLGQSLPPIVDRSWTFIDFSILLSVAYFALFAWLTARVIATVRPVQLPRS